METAFKIAKGVAPRMFCEEWEKLRPAIGIFCSLKEYDWKKNNASGSIRDFTANRKYIAGYCFCSPRHLHDQIKKLEKLGLVKRENGNLTLSSFKQFYILLGIYKRRMQYHRLEVTTKFKNHFYQLAIAENLESQQKEIERKISKQPNPCSDHSIQQRIEAAEEQRVMAFVYNTPYESKVNTDVTLNRASVAILFGRKSASTGSYRVKELKRLSLVEDKQRIVISQARCRKSDMGVVFYDHKDKVTCCQRANKLSVILKSKIHPLLAEKGERENFKKAA